MPAVPGVHVRFVGNQDHLQDEPVQLAGPCRLRTTRQTGCSAAA